MANNIEIKMGLDISKTMDSLKELGKFVEKNLSEVFEENIKKCQEYLEGLSESLLALSEISNESAESMITNWVPQESNMKQTLFERYTSSPNKLYLTCLDTIRLAYDEVVQGLAPTDLSGLAIRSDLDKDIFDNTILESQLQKRNDIVAKHKTEKEELENDDLNRTRFWADQTATTLQTFSNNFGELLGSGFGADGFENIAKSIKQGFKMVLVAILDSLSNLLYAGSLASLIKSLFNPLAVIEDAGKIVAGKIGLEVLKGMVVSMATGGMVTSPTLLMAGDAGTELYAPKQDFLTIARELIVQERRNMPAINQPQQKIIFEVRNGEFKVAGRDLVSTVTVNQIYDNKRHTK